MSVETVGTIQGWEFTYRWRPRPSRWPCGRNSRPLVPGTTPAATYGATGVAVGLRFAECCQRAPVPAGNGPRARFCSLEAIGALPTRKPRRRVPLGWKRWAKNKAGRPVVESVSRLMACGAPATLQLFWSRPVGIALRCRRRPSWRPCGRNSGFPGTSCETGGPGNGTAGGAVSRRCLIPVPMVLLCAS